MKQNITTKNTIYPTVIEEGEYEEITPVDIIFRVDTSKEWKETVFALFPHECADYKGNVTYYQHLGQHSAADYNHCIQTSRPAKQNEYAELKKEMEYLGYDITVLTRRNYDKYLKSYKEVNRIN